MAKVVLWERKLHKGSPGHIALEIDARNYVSWFPEEGRSIFNPGSACRDQSYQADKIRENHRDYDSFAEIHGLDEAAILQWWSSFGLMSDGQLLQGPMLPWRALKLNCSTVVATALRIGGGDKLVAYKEPKMGVYTPWSVFEYAKELEAATKKKR